MSLQAREESKTLWLEFSGIGALEDLSKDADLFEHAYGVGT